MPDGYQIGEDEAGGPAIVFAPGHRLAGYRVELRHHRPSGKPQIYNAVWEEFGEVLALAEAKARA